MSFNGAKSYFNLLDSWNLDAKTGGREVAACNNSVKNGSFEADRRKYLATLSLAMRNVSKAPSSAAEIIKCT